MAGIQEPSYIAKTAQLGENVFIAALAYLGENVVMGNNVKIFPHVFLGDNVKVGDNSIFHAGVKIYHDCVSVKILPFMQVPLLAAMDLALHRKQMAVLKKCRRWEMW